MMVQFLPLLFLLICLHIIITNQQTSNQHPRPPPRSFIVEDSFQTWFRWDHNFNNNNVTDTNTSTVVGIPFPVPAYSGNPFYSASGPLVAVVWTLSMLYPVSRFVKSVVEIKIKNPEPKPQCK